MSMHSRELKVSLADLEADLTISTETVLMGMRRTRLKAEASVRQEEDPDRAFLAVVTYPDLMAVSSGKITVDQETIEVPKDLDFERFLILPGELEGQWEEAVYALNPHFLPRAADEEAEKKRQPTSTSASSGSTTRKMTKTSRKS